LIENGELLLTSKMAVQLLNKSQSRQQGKHVFISQNKTLFLSFVLSSINFPKQPKRERNRKKERKRERDKDTDSKGDERGCIFVYHHCKK